MVMEEPVWGFGFGRGDEAGWMPARRRQTADDDGRRRPHRHPTAKINRQETDDDSKHNETLVCTSKTWSRGVSACPHISTYVPIFYVVCRKQHGKHLRIDTYALNFHEAEGVQHSKI